MNYRPHHSLLHSRPHPLPHSPLLSRQHGFTLVEVLISVLVLAIGLLGIAGLQAFGMRQTLNSHMLSIANSQANDMVERMQANRGELAKVKKATPEATAYDAITGSETDPGCIATKTCTSAQLAQYDAFVWATANKKLLRDDGNGSVSSSVTNNGDRTFTIRISWREQALSDEEDAADGTIDHQVTKTYATRFQP